jgi:carboxyl-terminal processing protease
MLCVFPLFLSGQENVLLQTKDIHKVMDQIFSQHVDKKEITSSIIKNSFKVYIDQFDPDRIYLLEQEVRPFLNFSDSQVEKFLEQYQTNHFQEYADLNQVIQKAILRQRQLRASLFKDQKTDLFEKSRAIKADGVEDWSDPDLTQNFAKDDTVLKEHLKKKVIQFIALERKRYGEAFINQREAQTLAVFDNQAIEFENPYLYLNQNGTPMNVAEKDNAFAMHVLKAISNTLDAHTTILNPTEAYDMKLRLEKGVSGVGIVVEETHEGDFRVSEILENSPAKKNGEIKMGDLVVAVDGESLKEKTMDDVIELLRGKPGTKAALDLLRLTKVDGTIDQKKFHVELERENIEVDEDRVKFSSVPYDNGIIGIITLDSFYQSDNGISSETDITEAIKKLKLKGSLRGIILDFRENSGGFLSQAIKVAGLFITNGIVVISKYFNGEEHFYRDMDSKVVFDGPLIILTSKATASAAEIVAQALQDYGVAVIVGDEHTYGKGTIQSQTVTEDKGGEKAAAFFKVTVGKYYTVSGKTPQIQGVKSDVVVPSQFAHQNIGEQYLENPLDNASGNDTIAPTYDDPLQDITAELKPWYMHYYMPTLQHRKFISPELLVKLKESSKMRIAKNQRYQTFLKGGQTKAALQAFVDDGDDIQLGETLNIMKEMIALEATHRGYSDASINSETVSNPKR